MSGEHTEWSVRIMMIVFGWFTLLDHLFTFLRSALHILMNEVRTWTAENFSSRSTHSETNEEEEEEDEEEREQTMFSFDEELT